MGKYSFTQEKRTILESMPQPLAVYQFIDGRIITLVLSDGFCDLFGYTDREKAYYDMNLDKYKFAHPDDVVRLSKAAIDFVTEVADFDIVYRSRLRNRSVYRIVHATGKHIFMEDGVRLSYVWYIDEGDYIEDSSDQESTFKRSLTNALHEESMVRTSRYDRLTGLPSMTYFFQLAEDGKAELKLHGEQAVLLNFDLNGMKFFNSKHSFAEGDKLLQSFARLLINYFDGDHCCHISADHFAVYTKEEGLTEILKALLKECKEINNGNFLPVRVGIYSTGLEDVPISVACDRAKLACDTIRNNYESGFQYFSQSMRDDIMRRQYILSHLDQALEEKWIQVYYQPIVRAVNGRVCDEEALARWVDPVEGFLSPAQFIPFLEDAGLIYKLDLYMLEQVLQKLKAQSDAGLFVVPQSINLSRSDFNACDIVEEICLRVDGSGVSRNMITIEITESTLGSDLDFMKQQIDRFENLGFRVWLDDFGTGYSSLDVLQSIKFDLMKFDMSFMRKMDTSDKSKTVLTELMKMANALNIDTVCEGVETKEQVIFLQEIGCSKLQGYYYQKPIPYEKILEKYEKGIQIGFENPDESQYYDAIGRVNLSDLSVISGENEKAFQNAFNMLPMGILELSDGKIQFIRSNKPYRNFIMRFFGIDLSETDICYPETFSGPGATFIKNIRQCCLTGNIVVFDEQMPDGSLVHSIARKIGTNQVTGKASVAVSVLSVTDANEGTTYASIARALAADYYNIYYVDLLTDRFIEYSSPVGGEELALERHGEHFFDSVIYDSVTRIYPEDREGFLKIFTKENIVRELDEQGVFTTKYRLINTGAPLYVYMKITRMLPDMNRIIIGISIIDSQMKQLELAEKIQREEIAYSRMIALSGDYIGLYTIEADTGRYFEYNATKEYESLGLDKQGEDFFGQSIINVKAVIDPEDYPRFLREFSKEKVLKAIAEHQQFQLHYRLMIGGVSTPVSLKIVSVRENDGEKLIAGVRAWKDRKK